MTDTTISVRPILITAQVFTDGVEEFETASDNCAWGIFATGPEINMAGTAPSRQAAIDAATQMAETQGWKIGHIAPEVGEAKPEESESSSLERLLSIGHYPVQIKGHVIDEEGKDRVVECPPVVAHLVEVLQGGKPKSSRIYWSAHEAEASVRQLTKTVSRMDGATRYIGPTPPGSGSPH